ncbi:hypothetical protein BGZ61DRAFT_537085 [Ilyonectria robusta]|uniref:uncharacterized protein n=1 Tax=Ilyonectria robusta TaxID=1079257 RepID=UPI001E8CAFF9|nr:uncharacterized protein BGZ61DRAFT_537085 [Ilyonectria robusta]KAH8672453.1 hypothetical protein BGZ61DRAFT_537085 [Ilyonectria robusta]
MTDVQIERGHSLPLSKLDTVPESSLVAELGPRTAKAIQDPNDEAKVAITPGACKETHSTIATIPRATPFPLENEKGLFEFKMDVAATKLARFREIVPEIERLLLNYLQSAKHFFGSSVPIKAIAIRYLVIGKDASDARDCLVVFCSTAQYKRIKRFFDNHKGAKALCEPPDLSAPLFRVIISPRPLNLTVGEEHNLPQHNLAASSDSVDKISDSEPNRDRIVSPSAIEVYCSLDQLSQETLCGTPIRFVNGLGESLHGTFGGIIKVVQSDGDFQLYGLTASHGLVDWQPSSVPPNSDLAIEVLDLDEETRWLIQLEQSDGMGDGMGDEICSEGEDNEPEYQRSLSGVDVDRASNSAWSFVESQKLGNILHMLKDYTDWKDQYLDWALFTLDPTFYRPNLFFSETQARKFQLTAVSGKSLPKTGYRPVVIMGQPSQDCKSGSLSTMPTRVLLAPGKGFVDVYTLSLDTGSVSSGDSGSWVIDPVRGKIYGHIIATDMLGEVYVIPLESIFEDIRRYYQANSVQISSLSDFVTKRKSLGNQAEHMAERSDLTSSRVSGPEGVPESSREGQATKPSSPMPQPVVHPSSSNTSRERSARTPADLGLGTLEETQELTSGRGSRRGRNIYPSDDASPQRGAIRQKEYFVPRDGIDREVISADITLYLGDDALVRPGHYEHPQTGQVALGYYITAYKNLSTTMIEDLKADSARWDSERRAQTSRNTTGVQYRYSETHQFREHHGPTEASYQQDPYAGDSGFDGPRYPGTGAPGYTGTAGSAYPQQAHATASGAYGSFLQPGRNANSSIRPGYPATTSPFHPAFQ